MAPFHVFLILSIPYLYTAKLSFTTSPTIDEYCVQSLNDNPVSLYCADIDDILLHYCGNHTFLTVLDPTYNALNDATDDECIFYLDDQQTINKPYSLSDDIQIDTITFSASKNATITLSDSFLSIEAYLGSINIENINFTSNGDTFSFIVILSEDIDDNELNININSCHLSDIQAVNGAIINIPNQAVNETIDPLPIYIVFEDCILSNNTAEYGGILYIERNNVYLTLSQVDIHQIVVTKGSVFHWICQENQNDTDLCGDIVVTQSTITNIDANIFNIDLSSDPAEIQFILDVDTSTFADINGVIFNFNNDDDLLSPSGNRIQEQNAFINIMHSTFEDNGHQTGPITQWNPYQQNYLYDYTALATNGTIFKISAVTVPNITIENSTFTNNAALHGTIFYWYCSRAMRWVKDNYCGSIALTNSVFDSNIIPTTDYFVRFGSLMYAQIHPFMEFNLMIDNCTIKEHKGNAIYIEKTDEDIPDIRAEDIDFDLFSNSSYSNFSSAMIYIENTRFMSCTDYQSSHRHDIGAILTIKGLESVYHYITECVFEDNAASKGSPVFLADYVPILNITNSRFTNNAAPHSGIIHVEEDNDARIEISDTEFRENGYYSSGGYVSSVSILSTSDIEATTISLDIIRSDFMYNQHQTYGLFMLYDADINITDCMFDTNQGLHWSTVILYASGDGVLNIINSQFRHNAEISDHFAAPTGVPRGMFNAPNVEMRTQNVEFIDNTVLTNGIFVSNKAITLLYNNYTGNDIARIVDGAENSVVIENCVFIDNDISLMFGFSEFAEIFLHISYSNFSNNAASQSGGIAFVNGSHAQIEIEHSVFESNAAEYFGGALYVWGTGYISIKDCEMIMNTAGIAGGFLFAKGVTLNITDTNTVNNVAFGNFGGFLYIENTTTTIKNVNFFKNGAKLSAGAIAANGYNTIEMEYCHFEENFGELGGAMYLFKSDLVCNKCSSDNNVAGTNAGFLYMEQDSNVYLHHAQLRNDHCQMNGGAIYLGSASDANSASYFECNYCNISNSSSSSGAILFSGAGNTVIINENNMFNAVSTASGGVLLITSDSVLNITQSVFHNNTAAYYGGAIYIGDNNEVNIWNSQFKHNAAAIGGAIAVQTGLGTHESHNAIYIDIEDTSFMDNIAYQTGGALYVKREAASIEIADTFYHYMNLHNNKWNDNKAASGGAIAMDFRSQTPTGVSTEVCDRDLIANQNVYIEDNIFMSNIADNNGDAAYGGVFYLRCMQLHVYKSQFESNYATYDDGGGVAYFSETKAIIDESVFLSTQHSIDHNAELFYMNAINDESTEFVISNCNISGYSAAETLNYTANYSLIAIGGSMAVMSFDNILFTDNGVALFYDQTFVCASIQFVNCTFTNNYGWTVIDMDHVTFLAEDALTIFDDVLFVNNTVTFGLIRLSTSYAHIYNSVITDNINTLLISSFILVSDVSISNTLIANNRGKYDGIIAIYDESIADIRDTHFINNTVGGSGGAIHSKASELHVNNCVFRDNSARLNGGHIAQYENILTVKDCVFEGGHASEGNGGALWLSRNNIISGMIANISNTSFKQNYALFHGGAILQDTPSRNRLNALSLRDVQFIENEASHSGAAIYIKNKFSIEFEEHNVRYTDNIAHVINSAKESWPFRYTLESNNTTICPGCNISVVMNAFNLFDREWIPHKFTEPLFIFDDSLSINDNISSIADFAVNIERDFEVKQRMISSADDITVATAQIHQIYQSDTFIQGVGSEIFSYGPAILGDTLTFIVTGYMKDGFVVINDVNISFTVDICNKHMGATVFDEYSSSKHHVFQCTECVKNHYRFIESATKECNSCPPRAVCEGGASVYVENDHYPLVTDNEPGFEVLECVPGTCCLQSLCLWSETDSLCPPNRNATSPMCSTCKVNYSVSPLSTECIECRGINIWYFIIPSICYGILIWWWGHNSPFSTNLASWEIYTFKTLSFYYQILPSINLLIPDQSETTDISATIEGIFNFDPQIEGVCAYENLTNLQQLLLSFVTPISCLLWIAFFSLLDKLAVCSFLRQHTQRTLRSAKLSRTLCSFFFFKAFVKFFIQVYAQLTRTSFSLLSCRSFNETNHMYYSADIECYQWWHSLAFLGVAIAIMLPVVALYLLYKAKKKLKPTAWWHILTLGYKRRVWWYDVFRMACRLFVILLVSVPVLEAYRLVLTRWLIYIYLIIHIWLHPFDRKKYLHEIGFDINHLETFCLGLLCVLVHLADYEQSNVLQVYNYLKLCPIVLLIILVIYKYSMQICCRQILPEAPINTLHTLQGIAAFKTMSNVHSDPLNMSGERDGTITANGVMTSIELQASVTVDPVMQMIDDDDEYEEELAQLKNITSSHTLKHTFKQKLEVSIKMLSFDKSKTKSRSYDGGKPIKYQSFDEDNVMRSPTEGNDGDNDNDEDNVDDDYHEFETPVPKDADKEEEFQQDLAMSIAAARASSRDYAAPAAVTTTGDIDGEMDDDDEEEVP